MRPLSLNNNTRGLSFLLEISRRWGDCSRSWATICWASIAGKLRASCSLRWHNSWRFGVLSRRTWNNLRYKSGVVRSIIIRSSLIHLSLGKNTLEEGMGCYNTILISLILGALLESERGFESKNMLGLSSTLWAGKCILSLIAIRSPSLSETYETKSLWPWKLMLISQHLSQDPCSSRNLWRDLTSTFRLSPTSIMRL